MASALPPNNTLMLVALGLGAAWFLSRRNQGAMAAGYGTPYATPMSSSYMQSPAVGGQSWFGSANPIMTNGRVTGYMTPQQQQQQIQQQQQQQQQNAMITQAGGYVGQLINRWLSPNTDAPRGSPVPDSSAIGSNPSMGGNWGYSAPQLPDSYYETNNDAIGSWMEP